jgi:hypothetical protein
MISSIRAVVENTIGQMKNWKILATEFLISYVPGTIKSILTL